MARARPAMEFGERLREALTRSGRDRQQLRTAAGVSKTAVSDWMMGYSWPRLDHAYKISACLGIGLDELGRLAPVADEPKSEGDAVSAILPGRAENDLVARFAELDIAPALQALTTATPDLIKALEEAKARARPH